MWFYVRVSTDRQGRSGLGLDAQRVAVERHLNGGEWKLLAEFVEIESGENNDRRQLTKALAHCRLTGGTLVVAKLDRLARNARFLLSVVEGTGAGGVVFCDLPSIPPMGKFMVTTGFSTILPICCAEPGAEFWSGRRAGPRDRCARQ